MATIDLKNRELVSGAAGQVNTGGGGDYFTPGKHKVQIIKSELGKSKKPGEGHIPVQIVEATVCKGGEGTRLYDGISGEKAIKREVAGVFPAPVRGRKQAWVNKGTDLERFQKSLGDFCLSAKQTFMALCAGDADENVVKYFKDNKGFDDKDAKRGLAFVQRNRANPTGATTEDDIWDVLEMDLAVGLVMTIEVTQYCNKKGNLSGITQWHPGTVEDQGLAIDDED